jgi:N6-L-threonylcarbamoyladenine synthase
VARLLSLPYPGGPEIEKLALTGNPSAIPFPRPMMHDRSKSGVYSFSFSGLKTAVLYYLQNDQNANKSNVAASFQQAAIDVLITKTMRATEEMRARAVLLSGGVAANTALRRAFGTTCRKQNILFFPTPVCYNTDNAVMIAVAAWVSARRKKHYPLTANGTLSL